MNTRIYDIINDFRAHSINASLTEDEHFVTIPVVESMGIISKIDVTELTNVLQDNPYNKVFDSLLSQILAARDQITKMNSANFKAPASYEEAKDSLIVRPMNYERHKEKLQNGVYRLVGDVALVLYHLIGDTEESMASHMITKADLASWNIPEEKYDDIIEAALDNTSKKFPATILDAQCNDTFDVLNDNFSAEDIISERHMTMLSTEKGSNGSTAIFYPGVARKIASAIGKFYVVFMNTTDVAIFNSEVNNVVLEMYREFGCEDSRYGESLSMMIFEYSEGGIKPINS